MSKDLDIEQAAQAAKPTTTIEVKAEPVGIVEVTAKEAPLTVPAGVAASPKTNGENNSKVHEQPQQQHQQSVTAAGTTNITTTAEQVQPTNAAVSGNANTNTTATSNNKSNNMEPSLKNFKVLYVLTQLVGLIMIVLVGLWIGQHFGGLGWTDNPALEFNWHPLFMTIGFIYLYGNSILIYRGFRTTRKKTLKLTHAGIHMTAFILTVIALKAVFDSHNLNNPPIPNLYSLHSWLGLCTVIIFGLQYVAGFTAYLWPGMRDNYKIALMPLHIYFGLFGFVLAIATAVMGITEKAIFAIGNYSQLPGAGVLANIIGVFYVIFGCLVVYIATEPTFKRQPLPEDAALLSNVGNE